MSDLVDDIAVLLSVEIVWLDLNSENPGNGTLFKDQMPDEPDSAASLHEYSGLSPVQMLGNHSPRERPRLQVVVRDPLGHVAKVRLKEILQRLNQVNSETVNGTYYVKISAEGGILPLGTDSGNRERFSANFQVEKDW